MTQKDLDLKADHKATTTVKTTAQRTVDTDLVKTLLLKMQRLLEVARSS